MDVPLRLMQVGRALLILACVPGIACADAGRSVAGDEIASWAAAAAGLIAAAVLGTAWQRVRRLRASERGHAAELSAALQARLESEERWRTLVEHAPDIIYIVGPDLVVTHLNRVAVGLRREDVLGHSVLRYVLPSEQPGARARYESVLRDNQATTYEKEWVRPDGAHVWYRIRIGPISRDGKVVAALSVLTDITEQKRIDQEMRDSAARYRQLVELSPDAIIAHDSERLVFANTAAAAMLGAATIEDLVGRPMLDFVQPQHHHMVRERVAKTIATGIANPMSERALLRVDGTPIDVEATSNAIAMDGSSTVIQVVMRDITRRKAAEIALRESESKFRAIFESSIDAVGVSKSGIHQFANRAYLKLFGYGDAEIAGRPIVDLLAPPERSGIADRIRRRSEGEPSATTYETIGLRKDGSEFEMEVHISTFTQEGDLHTVAVIRDISERKRGEEARRRLEGEREQLYERTELQLERLPLACIVHDAQFRVISWNPAADRMFGYQRGEVLGRNSFEMLVFPESRAHVTALFERLAAGELVISGEEPIITKSGRIIHCRWINNAMHTSDGAFIGVISMAQDVTEQKQLEERLRQSQKMEAVGQLAGGVAHDFNNLLTVITGYGQMLIESPDLASPQRRSAEQILKAATRAAGLTRQLLAFSRRQVLQPKTLDLNGIIADMEKLLRPLISEDIDILLSLSPTLGKVRADPGQFEQVIMNLTVNARDAMSQGGTLSIETSNVDFEAPSAVAAPPRADLEPGKWVMLAVRDTGHGMSTETLGHMFEPFFTTKEQGKGTGLGLATVYGIVKQSGGNILVYSEAGKGTSFEIYLPRIDESDDRTTSVSDASTGSVGDETLLLVEDDPDVLEFSKSTLARGGYRVLAARDGDQALALASSHQGIIHLAVCDVIMPGMSGREVVDRLSSSRPDMRSMFMSGYADKAIVHKGILAPGVVLIEKPFSAHALLSKVREVLDS